MKFSNLDPSCIWYYIIYSTDVNANYKEKETLNLVRCAIWYHSCNVKNVKNIRGGVWPVTLLEVTLLHGYFPRFLNCTNGIKSRKTSQMKILK